MPGESVALFACSLSADRSTKAFSLLPPLAASRDREENGIAPYEVPGGGGTCVRFAVPGESIALFACSLSADRGTKAFSLLPPLAASRDREENGIAPYEVPGGGGTCVRFAVPGESVALFACSLSADRGTKAFSLLPPLAAVEGFASGPVGRSRLL